MKSKTPGIPIALILLTFHFLELPPIPTRPFQVVIYFKEVVNNVTWKTYLNQRYGLSVLVDPTTGERVIKTMIWGMPYFDFIKEKLIRHHLFNAVS